jgi:hypothetical protein
MGDPVPRACHRMERPSPFPLADISAWLASNALRRRQRRHQENCRALWFCPARCCSLACATSALTRRPLSAWSPTSARLRSRRNVRLHDRTRRHRPPNKHAKTARCLRASFIDFACALLIAGMNALANVMGQSLFCLRLARSCCDGSTARGGASWAASGAASSRADAMFQSTVTH